MFAVLPLENGTLDAAIAVQSIHHARRAEIEGAIVELTRALRPGGLLFLTVPTLRNQSHRFQEIEPHTFVPLDGPEKGLPHHFFTEAELRDLLADFREHVFELDSTAHLCAMAVRR
jgi:SAM-dependent methyltransferase